MRLVGNIPALTSLRFFAALAVFANHAPDGLIPDNHRAMAAGLGASGVGFFFVLSGLILSHAYRGRLTKPNARTNYFAGRVARIWPLHLTTLVIFAAVQLATNAPLDFSTLLPNVLLLQAHFPWRDIYFSWNDVSWSLSAEIFFYSMFPLLLPGINRLSRGTALACLALIIALVFAWSFVAEPNAWGYWAVYVMPLARLADFTAGILLYRLIAEVAVVGRRAMAAEAAIIALILMLGVFFHAIPAALRLSGIFLPVALAIVGVFFVSGGPLARLLNFRPLVYLGEISFAFYMVHKIIIAALDTPTLRGTVTALAITLLAAIFLHHAVEIPANSWLRRILASRFAKARRAATEI